MSSAIGVNIKFLLGALFMAVTLFHIISSAPQLNAVNGSDPRIVNGTLALANKTKHQVSIRRKLNDGYFFGSGHICGGSLIRQNVVLTAAHCVYDYALANGSISPAKDFIIVTGNLDRFARDNNTLILDVTKIYVAENTFDTSTFEMDIALLYLNDSVPANHTTAQPIDLSPVSPSSGTICQVTGWGITENDTLSDFLMTVDVPIIDYGVCSNETNFGEGLLRPGMLCAGYLEQGERDACSGDSGGPLVCNGLQAGIVSWGVKCAQPKLPGVYTDVAYYLPWIEDKLNSAYSFMSGSLKLVGLLITTAIILRKNMGL